MSYAIPDYVQAKQAREKDALESSASDLTAWMAEAPTAPASTPVAPAGAPAASKPKANTGVITEVGKAVAGGIADAGANTFNLILDAANWLENNTFDLRSDQAKRDNPKVNGMVTTTGGAKASVADNYVQAAPVLDNQTTGGKIGRTLTQFAIPFAGGLRALKAVQVVGSAVKAGAAGAATDFTVFDPHEKRLSNMINEMAGQDSMFNNAVTQYLAANPNDTNMEGRFKNTLEGLGLGLAVGGVFKGVKAVRSHFASKGLDPAKAVQEAGAAHIAAAEAATAAKLEPKVAPSVVDTINKTAGVKEVTAAEKQGRARDVMDTFFGNPQNQKQLDAWEAAAASKEAADGVAKGEAKSAENLLRGQDNTALKANKAGEPVLIGHSADPVVHAFTEDFKALAIPVKAEVSQEVPGFLRSAEDLNNIRAYSQVQEATLQAFRDSFQVAESAKGAGQVLSDAERKYLQVLSQTDITIGKSGTKALGDAERVGIRTEGEQLLHEIRTRQAAIEKLAPAMERLSAKAAQGAKKDASAGGKINPDGTFNFTKSEGGLIDPQTLVLAGEGAAKHGMANGAVLGGAALANPEDPDADPVTKYANAVAMALAGYAGVKVFKHFKAGKAAAAQSEAKAISESVSKFESIAPIVSAAEKAVPRIPAAKVAAITDMLIKGDLRGAAKEVLTSDFNMARIDTEEGVKDLIDNFSAVFEKEITKASGGVKTFSDIKELALELGAGEGTLKELFKDTGDLAARVTSHRALLTASAERVTELSQAVLKGDSTDAILALRKQVALHAAIQAQMKGVQTEIARALSSFRITSTSLDLAINEKNALIEAMGGRKLNMDFAAKLSSISGDPALLNSVVRRTGLARTNDAIFEGWVNGVLSGAGTHLTNLVSNTSTSLFSVAERQAASLYGRFLKKSENAVQQAEVNTYVMGMYTGLRDALKMSSVGRDAVWLATKKFVTGDRDAAIGVLRENQDEMGGAWTQLLFDHGKTDSAAFGALEHNKPQIPGISSQNFDLDPNAFIGKFTDYLGAVFRTPGRMLSASDELFKTVFYRGEVNALAYRTAKSEGHEGDKLMSRIAELVDNPTKEISGQAIDSARRGTFQQPMGALGNGISTLSRDVPGMRYIIPFVRTPVNILSYVGERTPLLANMSSHYAAEVAAGGARADIAQAKVIMGGGLFAIGAGLAAQGVLTGGGEYNRTAERLNGWRPYSVKLGDEYYSINRLDPIGLFLTLTGDFTEMSGHLDDKTAGELTSAMVLSISRNVTSKTYVKGVSELLNAMSEEARGNTGAMDRWKNNFGSSFVPFSSAMNNLRRQEDNEAKEVMTLMDAVKARLPGFSKEVNPTVNLFGEDIHYDKGLGPDIASPVTTSTASLDKSANEIARLNVDLKHPPKKLPVSEGVPGIDLTPDQYYKLQKVQGEAFRKMMVSETSKASWDQLPEFDGNKGYQNSKQLVIKVLHARAYDYAKGQLLSTDAGLMRTYKDTLNNKGLALRGQPVVPLKPQQ